MLLPWPVCIFRASRSPFSYQLHLKISNFCWTVSLLHPRMMDLHLLFVPFHFILPYLPSEVCRFCNSIRCRRTLTATKRTSESAQALPFNHALSATAIALAASAKKKSNPTALLKETMKKTFAASINLVSHYSARQKMES